MRKVGGYIDGRSAHDLFDCWKAMKGRCRNPKFANYKLYGARGIDVCERWMDFWNFVVDMGVKPTGFSIERIDNDGHYEPGNCRWASMAEQGSNRLAKHGKRNSIRWKDIHGIEYVKVFKDTPANEAAIHGAIALETQNKAELESLRDRHGSIEDAAWDAIEIVPFPE